MREFDVIPAKGAPYWPSITQYTRVRVKPDIFEKFKINISARCIHTKLSTRKRLNTKNLLLIYYRLSENDKKFRKYSTFSRYVEQNIWPSGEYKYMIVLFV